MARKKKQTVQAKKRGPASAGRPKTVLNGQAPGTHHLVDAMGKKPGMTSTSVRRACELAVDPMSPGPPVFGEQGPIAAIHGSTWTTWNFGSQVESGRFTQSKFTTSFRIGSGGVGVCMVATNAVGNEHTLAGMKTNELYAGTSMPNMAAANVLKWSPAEYVPGSAGINRLLGLRMTLAVNEGNPDVRAGTCILWEGDMSCVGLTADLLKGREQAQTYPATVFDTSEQLVVHATPPDLAVFSNTDTTSDFFSPSYATLYPSMGFFVSGAPAGATFDVTVEIAVFTYGWSIPRTITPIVSNEASDCVKTCLAELRSKRIGASAGDRGQVSREVHRAAERHSVMNTARPVLSALWPQIKQLASSAVPQLMSLLV